MLKAVKIFISNSLSFPSFVALSIEEVVNSYFQLVENSSLTIDFNKSTSFNLKLFALVIYTSSGISSTVLYLEWVLANNSLIDSTALVIAVLYL